MVLLGRRIVPYCLISHGINVVKSCGGGRRKLIMWYVVFSKKYNCIAIRVSESRCAEGCDVCSSLVKLNMLNYGP